MKHRGILLAGGAYVIWGFLPLYWRLLRGVPALEILCHRIVWALLFTTVVLSLRGGWGWVRGALRDQRTVLSFIASTALLSINWLTYIWAVNAGFVVESSLGYFITPLLNVAMGVIILHERMRPGQWVAIGLAIVGVFYLTVAYGQFPWIGLTLAFSFATYGLLRKQAKLNSLQGLTFETALAAIPALVYLVYLSLTGQGAFGAAGVTTTLLLAFAGAVTAIPLLMFAAGVRLLPLTTLGVLQYIAPTIQFALGVFVFGEPFNLQRLIGFCLVWLALAVFTAEGYLVRRRAMALRVP